MKKPSKFLFLKSFLIASIALNSFFGLSASAASITGFNPGNIMSDIVMRNHNSMTQAQIQTFLKSKNSCNDTNVAKAAPYISRGYQYHIINGRFVCMADENFNGKSAAQIIYEAAQKYKINPQVLLVLLQKEQGLVTDTWPNSRQYKAATGYGCPSSSACSDKYSGFENQIYSAASLFNDVLNGGWSSYPVGNRYVPYHPNAQCGGTTINIANKATSALYRYTPYQPNSAALAAGTGTGDNCSSYGNRNFYYYFTNWFGSTQEKPVITAIKASVSPTTAPTQIKYTSQIYIPDGDYNIVTPSGKALDVALDGYSNYSNIQIWHRNHTGAQIFNFKRNKDGTYTIKNPQSGKVLEVSAFSNRANVHIYTSNNTCAQKWAANYINGRYIFTNACSGYPLSVANGSINTSGTNVWAANQNNNSAQSWGLISLKRASVAAGNYRIIAPSGHALDIGSVATRTPVKLWTRSSVASQVWQFIRSEDGFYTIKNVQSGKVLELASVPKNGQAYVQIYPSNNTCAQKWSIVRSNGTATIRNCYYDGLALDISGGSKATIGTVAQVWPYNGTLAQKWTLVKN